MCCLSTPSTALCRGAGGAETTRGWPGGARQLNKCHSTNTTEGWRRIPYNPSNRSRQPRNTQRRLYEKAFTTQAACLYATQAHAEVSRGAFLGWVAWMPIIGQKWPCNGTMWSILYLSSNVNIASVPLSTSRRGESAGVVCTMHGFAAPLGKQGPSLTGKRSITVQIARLPN